MILTQHIVNVEREAQMQRSEELKRAIRTAVAHALHVHNMVNEPEHSRRYRKMKQLADLSADAIDLYEEAFRRESRNIVSDAAVDVGLLLEFHIDGTSDNITLEEVLRAQFLCTFTSKYDNIKENMGGAGI